MSSLSLKHIYKVYDGGVKAVNDFCMDIKDKEFIVFVGPSGCGKSTTLRMIAGLEEITAGELMIGDEVVNDVEPKDRNIAMVFQNYALYPHMTVRENMAFALRLSKQYTEEEIMAKVDEAAQILDITQYLDRKPRALSGGQRQRVSLGRAIVRQPKVFLLDEPLSNLDAKLRAQMRTEITKLHQKLATTFIYVTHDQVEAMTMGTRIVVMKLGVVQQIDTPQNLYRYPGNKFVAGFIGTPQMNFYDATLTRLNDGRVEVKFANDRIITIPQECVMKAEAKYFDGKTVVTFGVRPEDIHYDEEFVSTHTQTSLVTKTSIIEALGSESIVYCELDENNMDSVSESETRMVLKVDPRSTVQREQEITIAIDPERIHLFDKETEQSIMPRIPAENVLSCEIKDNMVKIPGMSFMLPPAIAAKEGTYNVHIPSDALIIKGYTDKDIQIDKSHLNYSVTPDVQNKKQQMETVVQNLDVNCFAPSDFNLKELITAKVESFEYINDIVLLRLSANGNTLFATAPQNFDSNLKEVEFALDWKKLFFTHWTEKMQTVITEGTDEKGELVSRETEKPAFVEEIIYPALKTQNVLSAKLTKEKVLGALSKEYNFALNIANVNVFITEYVKTKLFNATGRKAFSVSLDIDFGVYNALLLRADTIPDAAVDVPDVSSRKHVLGIPVKVTDVLDYSIEKIAKCDLNGVDVYVSLRDNAPEYSLGEELYLALNIPTLGIVEADRGIRII